MSFDHERLLSLLPAIYRVRDAQDGDQGPLGALLQVIAREIGVVEEDLAQLYDDLFIETCALWVVPYLGDLLGVRGLHPVSSATRSQRAYVANTLAYRRRKGTAAVLEQLARDVTGWNARAVEFWELLSTTQYLNHLRLANRATPDLRQWEPLERINTAFDSLAHTVDVRRIARERGRYNLPNVGLFVWRLDAYALTQVPATPVADPPDVRYMLNPLGNNTQLFTLPETEATITHLAEPINVPEPISRRVLDAQLEAYYGPNKSIFITLDGVPVPDPLVPTETIRDHLVICDLSDTTDASGDPHWAHLPRPDNRIALDPVLGRIAVPPGTAGEVCVTFHYGFSAPLGGGEYERAASFDNRLPSQQVAGPSVDIQAALQALNGNGVLEIGDSRRYERGLPLDLSAAQRGTIELRAANGARPTLVLPSGMTISGADDAEVILNGLVISGQITVSGQLRRLRLRHCTLVPGLTLAGDHAAPASQSPSLIVQAMTTTVELDHCIVGGLRVVAGAEARISNSIVDAGAETDSAYAAPETGSTYAAPDGATTPAGGRIVIENSTIIGTLHTTLLELVSNSILLAAGDTRTAPVISDRRQEGCVRYSYVPLDARVGRRYHCQPTSAADAEHVRPQFTTLRYGLPGYCQLSRSCAPEIREGADDEAEMGVFHDLFQPQRLANLRSSLDEYLRFGLEAGIFFAS